jgi:hypothetical protein
MGTCSRDAVTSCAQCHIEVCTVHFFSTGKRFFCTSCYKDEYSIHDQQAVTGAAGTVTGTISSSDSASDSVSDSGQFQEQEFLTGLKLQAPPEQFKISSGDSDSDEWLEHTESAVFQGHKEPPAPRFEEYPIELLEDLPEDLREAILEKEREERKKEPTVYVDVTHPKGSQFRHSSRLLAGRPTSWADTGEHPTKFTKQEAQLISQESRLSRIDKYSPKVFQDPKTSVPVHSVFPLSDESTFEVLHSVRGEEIIGLLIDPGASKGLIGMDTVGDIQEWILEPNDKMREVFWYPSNAGFSGISASVEKAVALVVFPIGLAGMRGTTFKADVIGGAASRCPGLIPLQSLIQAATVAVFGCFPNGDGIFAFKDGVTGQLCPQRVFRTDSGHYLLNISLFNKPVDNELLNFLSKHFQYKLMKTVPIKKGSSKSSVPPTRPPGRFSRGPGTGSVGTFLVTHLGDFPPDAGTQTAFQASSSSQDQEEEPVFR